MIEIKNYNDLDSFPPIVYKYRDWEIDYHKDIILEQTVFLAQPTSFEDPYDCKLLKRYDLIGEREIFEIYVKDSKTINPLWTRNQHRKYAKDHTKNSPLKNKEHIKLKQEEHFKQFDVRFGVLSLTANPKRPEMWDKYANKHTGFCVGFDSKKMFKYFGGGGDVAYYEQLPDILYNDKREEEHFKQVFSKLKKWEFEEEYRLHKFSLSPLQEEERKVKLDKECFKEIIFGYKMNKNDRQNIIDQCNNLNLEVVFFEEIITNGAILVREM